MIKGDLSAQWGISHFLSFFLSTVSKFYKRWLHWPSTPFVPFTHNNPDYTNLEPSRFTDLVYLPKTKSDLLEWLCMSDSILSPQQTHQALHCFPFFVWCSYTAVLEGNCNCQFPPASPSQYSLSSEKPSCLFHLIAYAQQLPASTYQPHLFQIEQNIVAQHEL